LTTLVTVDVRWRNFLKSRVWDKVPEGSTLILEIPESRYDTVYDRLTVAYAKNELDPFSRFDTIPVCDGRSDRSIALNALG